ncbi:MAG TPA: glycosyltransferase family 39 protein [Pyrinomonadaceae bacterium]|nr:glycosyltransferase family 39 protein [Pyrinomonadaceae bacterium]
MPFAISPDSEASFEPVSNRKSVLFIILIAAIFAGARLWRLTTSCLWFDEIFSVHAAKHDWNGLFHFVAADIIHPPLFYLILKIWILIGGDSLLWLRLLPALIGILCVVPFILLCRELKLKNNETILALLLLAVNGYLIKYAQEVRMYSLLFFLSVTSLWLFFKLLNRDRPAKALVATLWLVNLLMVYSHYAGWLVVLLQAAILVCWQRRKVTTYLITLAALMVAYVPWIYLVSTVARSGGAGRGVAENIGWVAKPGLLDLVQYFILLNRPFLFVQSSTQTGYNLIIAIIAFTLFGVPLLLLLWTAIKRRSFETPSIYALAVFLLAPAVLLFLGSWLFPYSIWGTRHLIIATAPYAVLASLALTRLQPFILRTTALVVIGCWVFLSAAVFSFSRPQEFIWCSWESLALHIPQVDSSQPDQVYAYEDLVAYHLWFALNQPANGVSVVKGVPGVLEDPAYFLPRAFSDIAVQQNPDLKGNNVWVAFRAVELDESRPPLNGIRQSGFEIERVFSRKAQGQQAFLVKLRRTAGNTR